MSTTKQQLEELNKKFDVLISIMTNQTTARQPELAVTPVVVEPVQKKRGRPKKTVTQQVTPQQPAIEKMVELFVSPCMRINDVEYGGRVKVPEGIATQLRWMMDKYRQYEQRTQQFIDHGTRDHGVIS